MKKISWVGVAVGNVLDLFLTAVSSAVVLLLFAAVGNDPFGIESGDTEALFEDLSVDPTLNLVAGGTGVLCSIVAGYVSATIAKHDERLNGTLSCVLGSALTVWTLITTPAAITPERTVLTVVLAIGGGWLGGFLRARFKKKAPHPSEAF